MLTKKQSELLRFIHERLQDAGVPPSFDEMKEALDLRSKSGIHRLISGFGGAAISFAGCPIAPGRSKFCACPESATVPAPRSQKFSPSVIEGNLGRVRPAASPSRREEDSSVSVPIMGRIAAGTPISAIQTRTHTISIPPDFLGSGEHFALEVRGDSMIEAGIFEDDTVIIRRQDDAETGDIVVALIDDEEATLKRLRRRGASIALEAANPAYETRIFGPDRVTIQGKLVSLIRRY